MKKIHLGSNLLLNKKKILIIGSDSTLGKELILILKNTNIKFDTINKKKINFLLKNSKKKLDQYLKKKPDIIINFVGRFDTNQNCDEKVLFVNIIPTWFIIKYYLKKKIEKKTNIISIGSSSQNLPRKNYMLYAASKTALNNLANSGNDYFKKTKLQIKIFNPKTFGGKHLQNFKKKQDIQPIQVAKSIYRYITNL